MKDGERKIESCGNCKTEAASFLCKNRLQKLQVHYCNKNRATRHSKLKLEAGMKSAEAVEKCWDVFFWKRCQAFDRKPQQAHYQGQHSKKRSSRWDLNWAPNPLATYFKTDTVESLHIENWCWPRIYSRNNSMTRVKRDKTDHHMTRFPDWTHHLFINRSAHERISAVFITRDRATVLSVHGILQSWKHCPRDGFSSQVDSG